MPKPLYVAWATTDTFYLYQAERLAQSLNLFGLESHVVFRKRPGGWAACCFAKPLFILEMFDTFPDRDILYIDADAEIMAYPELLDDIQTDLAFVENGNGTIISSMIYFQNNTKNRLLIADWIQSNKMFPNNRAADQENFSDLVHAYEAGGKTTATHLPSCYNFEDGISKPISEPVVIYQWIASRIGRSPEFAREIALCRT